MTDVAGEAASAAHGLEMGAEELADTAVEYIVPVVAGVGGFFSSHFIGGAQMIADAVYKAGGDAGYISGATANRIGALLIGILYLIIGVALWGLRTGKGIWRKAVGGGFGGFAIGLGLGWAPNILSGAQPGAGWLDNWTKSNTVAGG